MKLVPANNATEKAVHVLDDAAAIGNIEDSAVNKIKHRKARKERKAEGE